MIRHCVFIRFKSDTPPLVKTEIYRSIAALKSRLGGMLAVHAGQNVSPETGMDKGYTYGFVIDFDDDVSRDVYLEDAEHKEIGARIVAHAEGGVEGVLVFDLDMKP